MAADAGYSGTPLHRKTGVRPGALVLAIGLPEGYDTTLLDDPGAATLDRSAAADAYHVVLRFCPDAATLRETLPGALAFTGPGGRCWIAWSRT